MHRFHLALLSSLAAVTAVAAQSTTDAARTSIEATVEPQQTLWPMTRTIAAATAGFRRDRGALAPTASFLSTDEVPEGDMPRNLAYTPDGSTVVIANRDTDSVTFLDVVTRQITHTVAVGDFPVHVAVSPDGRYAIVPNVFDDNVSIIDIATHAVVATVAVTGQEPYRIAVTSDSRLALVGVINDAVNSTFSVIDLTTLTEVRSFASTPQGVFGAFFTPEVGIFGNIFTQFALAADDRTVILPDRFNSRVAMYDLTTGTQVAMLSTATLPTAVDISADGTVAVVSHEGNSRTITEIDVVARAVSGAFATAVDIGDQVIRITPSKSHALAAVLNALIFVDLTSGATTATISTGVVGDIEITFDGQFAVVPNFNTRIISIASQTLVKTITFEAAYDAAISPVDHRMVALDNRFRENALVYNVNGANGFFEGKVFSGAIDEGDATRSLALSQDGRTLIANNNISENVAIVDVATETVRAYVDTGERVWAAAVTRDGNTAVVTNTETSTVSIIDLTTDSRVAQLSVPTRPTEVVISPSGSTAWVTTVAGTDRLAVINLAGAASSVIASLPTGQLGTIGYTYSVASGMAISPDGAIVAVCVSFDDQLMLVDTATRTEVARLAVGDFPVRVTFSPDSRTAFVTHAFGDSLAVVDVPARSVLATVPGIEFPLQATVDDAGAFVYVGSWNFSSPRVFVVSATSRAIVGSVALSSLPRSQHFSAIDDTLYVSLTDGDLVRIRAAGAGSALIDSVPLTDSPADMVFSESLRRALLAQPGARDGLDVIAYGGVFANYGPALAGSGGLAPRIAGSGNPTPGGPITIAVTQGLGAAPGVLLIGTSPIVFPFFGGTILALPTGSVPHTLGGSAGVAGAGAKSFPFVIPIDTLGARLYFQGIYLDAGAVQGLSMTDGLEMVIG